MTEIRIFTKYKQKTVVISYDELSWSWMGIQTFEIKFFALNHFQTYEITDSRWNKQCFVKHLASLVMKAGSAWRVG